YWAVVGPDFSTAVEWFFEHGDFAIGYNSLFVALIPKVLDPKVAVEAGIFTGFRVDHSITLSHLFYADDAVFIGMSINIQKSHLLGVDIPDNCVAEAAKSIGCSIMKAPLKYLAVTATWTYGSRLPACGPWPRRMSVMTNITPIVTIVMKAAKKEKTSKEADATLKVNILDFCEEHYEDILSVIMDKIHREKRKEVHARLDFGESPKKIQRVREGSQTSSVRTLPARYRNPSERPKMRDRLRYNDENVFDRLGRKRQTLRIVLTVEVVLVDRTLLLAEIILEAETASAVSKDHMEGKANPRYLACRRAAPAMEDTRSQIQKDASLQQKKYFKDLVKIHNIKQRDGETIKDFMKRFKPPLPSYEEKRPPLPKRKVTHRGNHKTSPIGMFQSEDLTSEYHPQPTIMLKFPADRGIVTIRSTILIATECATMTIASKKILKEVEVRHKNFKIALHLNFLDQEVAIGGTISAKGRTKLCLLLKENLDIFAWQPSNMTRVQRLVAEHRLNIRERYTPVRQKKRGQAPERARAIQVEACLQDCHHLPEIDWKVKSLYGYPFKCYLDAYKGYRQIQMVESHEEKTAFHTSYGVYCYTKMPFGLKNASVTHQRLVDKAFDSQKINMKLNLKKCTFGAVEGIFLGYMNSLKGIKSCPDKTEGAGLILTSLEGTEFTYALRFQFTASNKEAENEALIAGLLIAEQMGVHNVKGKVFYSRYGLLYEVDRGESRDDNHRQSLKKFVWDNIVCRFGLPEETVSDNDKQFSDNPFNDWCENLNITQRGLGRRCLARGGLKFKSHPAVIGVKLLRRAVSRDADFISGLVMRRAVNAVDLMGLLSQLHDPLSELLLLGSCMGIAKLFFGLKTGQPVHMEEADLFVDKGLLGSIENMVVCGEPFFGDLQWRLASLPIRFTGLGLYSAKVASSYTFVASRGQSWVLIDHILRDSGMCRFTNKDTVPSKAQQTLASAFFSEMVKNIDDYSNLPCEGPKSFAVKPSTKLWQMLDLFKSNTYNLPLYLGFPAKVENVVYRFEEVPNREGSITKRNTDGNRPSKAGVEKNERQEMNLPLLWQPTWEGTKMANLWESLSTFYKEGRYPKLYQTVTYLCTMGPRIVIKSTSEEDMLTDIQETFQRFRSINMKLKPKKFSFGVKEGPFLGYLITKKGTRANPLKALMKPERLGRVAKWEIKLGEHDIVFLARADSNKKMPKDFLIEAPPVDHRKEVGRRTDMKLEEMKSSC
nr:reverse transcriptase domain-containing protein [Tanacetum cinerariifolium]